MVDIKNDRWVTPENVFASRVMLPDLNDVFEPKGFFRWLAKEAGAESIVIEPGTIAYFVEDGEAVGHLAAGQHTLQSVLECLKFWNLKQATVILTRGEDQHLDIDLGTVPTRVGLLVDVKVRLSIQISDVGLFLANYMGVESEISFEHLRENLIPIIAQSAKQAVRLCSEAALQSAEMAETLSAAITDQLGMRMNRYGLKFIQTEALDIGLRRLEELQEKRGDIWLAQQNIKDNVDRLQVNSDLRKQHLSGAIDKIETKEEYAEFLASVDKDKVVRQDDVDELVFEFENRSEDRESLRNHLVSILDYKRDFELESLNADFEHQTDMAALSREIELASVNDSKESAGLIQLLERKRIERDDLHEQKRADWGLWREKQDVQRDDSWESILHQRQLQDVENEMGIADVERDSRIAMIQDEMQNRLETSKLLREQRRKAWELEVEDQEATSQMDRLKSVQEMNARFLADEARLKTELDELKLDNAGKRERGKIELLRGSTTEELVALADEKNARLLVDLKANESASETKQEVSLTLAKAAEDKAAAVKEVLKEAMDVQKDVIAAITSNSNPQNNPIASAPQQPPPQPPQNAAIQWYLARDGQTHGPYLHDVFVGYVSNGTVTVDTQIQKSGTNHWTRAGDCPEFVHMFGSNTPPPPPPPVS